MRHGTDRAALKRVVHTAVTLLFLLGVLALLVYIAMTITAASFLPLFLRIMVAALCAVMAFACVALAVSYIS